MSLCQQLAAYFEARPGEWINALDLLPVAGFAAWRTRLSELRRPPFNLTIENRWRTVENENGTKYRISEYRLKPFDFKEAWHAAPDKPDAMILDTKPAAVARPSLGNGLPRSVERMASPGRLFDDPR